jgi:hypothetical protein
MSATTTDSALPPMLALGDAFDRIEANTTDPDGLSSLADCRDLLDRIAERDPDRRASLVNDLDNLVDSLRTHVNGDAEFWAETVQNRVANYRRTRREASDTLHLGAASLEVDGEAVGVTDHRGSEAHLRGTLVNNGEPGDAIVQLAFYDEAGVATWTVESREFAIDAGEHRDLDLHIWIPEDADHYAVTALDVTDPRSTGQPPTQGK